MTECPNCKSTEVIGAGSHEYTCYICKICGEFFYEKEMEKTKNKA